MKGCGVLHRVNIFRYTSNSKDRAEAFDYYAIMIIMAWAWKDDFRETIDIASRIGPSGSSNIIEVDGGRWMF